MRNTNKGTNINGTIFTTRYAPIQNMSRNVGENVNNVDNIIDEINRDLSEVYNHHQPDRVTPRGCSNELSQTATATTTAVTNRFKVVMPSTTRKVNQPQNYNNYTNNGNHNNKPEVFDIKKLAEKVNDMDAELDDTKSKLYSLRKKVHYMKKSFDTSYNEIGEIGKRIDNVCGNNSKRYNVEIVGMTVCEKIPIHFTDNIISVCGTFKLDNLNITDITGHIQIDKLDVNLSKYAVTGYLKILIGDMIYDGIIFSDTKIKYIISSKMIAPIGINVSATLLIDFKLVKTK